ncbi:hypothetical protein KMC57_gp59 [Achromobacter phage vB_AxyP_19-32_Axy24]|uniref:Uncharacterized protein n=1 Tax=Achromobacter phage vB_AxyP_19-32_Axy24 TaxID=2591048 RepID=A0A514CW56_9CAUD|nr:hypothetical protein KMC57_gp59 [Achromobacter phage vB_AxyP_19-32_Axy24]QDH84724.1 hypothetical protein Axy24_059 [Achromobacter phage vB_AxyP_19-32_Axy24]
MGFFSGSTKVYVASSVYNLAGDIKDRADYLKTNVIGSMLSDSSFGMGELIPKSYLNGPGIRMRSFARWARNGYEQAVGIAYGALSTVGRLNNDVIAQQIPVAPGFKTTIQTAKIGYGDFTYWADQYVINNRPDKSSGTWESDFNNGLITITYPDGSKNQFAPLDYNPSSLYLYAMYNLAAPDTVGPYITGAVNTIGPTDPFPSTTGWDRVSEDAHNVDVVIHTKVETSITWSDGRPPYSDVWEGDYTDTYTVTSAVWTKTDYLGVQPGTSGILRRKNYMFLDHQLGPKIQDVSEETVVEDDGGVTKTTHRKTTKDVQQFNRTWRTDYQETVSNPVGPLRVFIYKQGSGNAVLDAMFQTQNSGQRFFPFIPIKLKSWVGGDLQEKTTRAFKKATGGKLSKVVTELKKNKDIGDIQYIYGVFGASLNTPENTAREYIFRFYELMLESSPPHPDYPTMNQWKAAWNLAYKQDQEWTYWYNAQRDWENPLYGKPEPPRGSYPVMPSKSFRIRSSTGMEYDMEISWNMLEFTTGTGKLWTDAKPGTLRFLDGGREKYPILYQSYDDYGGVGVYKGEKKIEKIILQWQVSMNQWRQMVVYGTHHKNRVYDGKSVDIDGREALGDAEESGFIIPLHEDIFRSMPLVRSTQMATASNYLVLNSYKKVKKKWYQTGIFQVVVIVVITVITIYSGGAGAGLLGANVAVGAALGFTGLAALIVGAIANALAAMILTAIIQKGATMLFGEKLGAIIGTIASLIAIQVGTAMANGQTMSTMMGQMMRADNLLKLTSTMGNAVSQYINAGTQDLMRKTEDMMQAYNRDMTELQRKYEQEFGYSNGTINPLSMTDAFALSSESRDSFLSRTLMTGSDIADMSNSMISNFSEMNLQLDY